jgi:conserved hypothetical protein, YceG family
MSDHIHAEPTGTDGRVRMPIPKWRITMYVILSLLFLIAAGVGGVLLYVWNGLKPAAAGEPVRIEIPSGASAFRTADLLEQHGIIRNAFLFKYYLRLKDQGDRFQAGLYEMAPGMTNDEIIAMLNEGRTVKPETFRFTIPEGYTIEKIADKLAAEGLVDKSSFLALADSAEARGWSSAAASVPEDEQLLHPLEGYLFPETYEMEAHSTEADILKRMMAELDRKLNQLPENWQDILEERNMTLHDLLTVASLIEREVAVAEERPIVASVIYNRLKEGMPLQIDATVQYALGGTKERLLEEDLEIDSPYNTYKIPALPPGPIASPSLSAIQAALEPEETEYLYYVTKKDGSRTHLFAKTFKEHQENIRKSEAMAAQGGGG